jgi:hypothetical protein
MDEDLEAILQTIEQWQDAREGIRQRASSWVASAEFVSCYYDNAHVPGSARSFLRQQAGTKEGDRAWREVRGLGIQNADLLSKYQALARVGEVVFAHCVIANPGLSTMPVNNLPCLLVVSVEQDSVSVATAGLLAAALGELYCFGTGGEERPQSLRLVRDDDYHLLRRRPLPLAETQGFPATLLDMPMRQSWMPPKTLPFIPLLMTPETGGAVVQIPWHIVMGSDPGREDLEPGVWHEIGAEERLASSKPRQARASISTSSRRLNNGRVIQPPPLPDDRPFSARILLLRIFTSLSVLTGAANIVFILQMQHTNFSSGFFGGYQQALINRIDVSSWEAMGPPEFGVLIGYQITPLIFSILGLIAAFCRMRTLSIVAHSLMTLQGLSTGLPLLSGAGLVLSCIPGRSNPWKRSPKRR